MSLYFSMPLESTRLGLKLFSSAQISPQQPILAVLIALILRIS